MLVMITKCLFTLVTVLSAPWIAAHCADGGVRREGLSSLLTCLDRDSEWTSWNSTSGKTALEATLSKYNPVSWDGLGYKLGEERSALQESGKLSSCHQRALEPAHSPPPTAGFSFRQKIPKLGWKCC